MLKIINVYSSLRYCSEHTTGYCHILFSQVFESNPANLFYIYLLPSASLFHHYSDPDLQIRGDNFNVFYFLFLNQNICFWVLKENVSMRQIFCHLYYGLSAVCDCGISSLYSLTISGVQKNHIIEAILSSTHQLYFG